MNERTITIKIDFGDVSWEKTYKDGEIGEGTLYTIEEWRALSSDERALNVLAWCGAYVSYEVNQDSKEEGE